jgi:hypothetical protein
MGSGHQLLVRFVVLAVDVKKRHLAVFLLSCPVAPRQDGQLRYPSVSRTPHPSAGPRLQKVEFEQYDSTTTFFGLGPTPRAERLIENRFLLVAFHNSVSASSMVACA